MDQLQLAQQGAPHDHSRLVRDRLQARRQGVLIYLPTKPFKRGHIAPTKTYGRDCSACVAEDAGKVEEAKKKAAAKSRQEARKVPLMAARTMAREDAREAAREAATLARREAKGSSSQGEGTGPKR